MGTRKRKLDHSHGDHGVVADGPKTGKRCQSPDCHGSQWTRDLHVCLVSSSILLAIYLHTMYPSVPGGDSGELIVVAHEMGVAHPPGYPLFTLMTKAFMSLVPIGQPAWRANLMNAIISALAGGTLQLAVIRSTGCVGSSLCAMLLFSLGRLTWTWAGTAEVFALNNLLLALLLLLSVLFEQASNIQQIRQVSSWGAFVCSLLLCNQHTAVIYVIIIALWVLIRLYYLQLIEPYMLLRIGVAVFCGLLPYLYLPFSSICHIARWTWGEHLNFHGILNHVFRTEYGTFQLGKNTTGLGFIEGVRIYCVHIWEDFMLFSLLLPVAAILALKRSVTARQMCLLMFILMMTVYMAFFAWRANLDTNNPLFKGVVERFWMQSDIVVAFLIGVVCAHSLKWLTQVIFGKKKSSLASIFACVFAVVVASMQLKKNYSICDHGNDMVVHDFGSHLLRSFPPNALILTKGDLPTNVMRYLHLCENLRPDLSLLDVEILSYQWSLPRLKPFYPKVRFPGDYWRLTNKIWDDGRKSFNFKRFLDVNSERVPIFACIGMQARDSSWEQHYQLWPYGPCHQVVSVKEPFTPSYWAEVTAGLADAWSHPYDGYDDTSWEKVANDEMWNAKVNSPFFMYKQAEAISDPVLKTEFLQSSYDMYLRALQLNKGSRVAAKSDPYPTFWHKNFGLVCERLLRSDQTKLDKVQLCKLSIQHFRLYLSLAPEDPDGPQIQAAIDHLKENLEFHEQKSKVDAAFSQIDDRIEKIA